MEKTVVCWNCKKPFELIGPGGESPEVRQGVICPYCNEPNVVMWPIADGWEIIKD